MNELKDILQKHNFKFNKNLGQNFITDTNLLQAIVKDSKVDKRTVVVEIGAGGGTLTREIAKVSKKVYAYEIDENLKPILKTTLKDFDNVELNFTDILKKDIKQTEKEINEEYIVIANLPYYITTPLILYFIENSKNCKSLTVMVQKEVALRLCAKAGSKEYGSITVAVDFNGGAKILRTVSKNLFYPVPKVDSAVVKIDINRNNINVKDKDNFYKLYRCAFSMRRKTLVNNISKAFNINKITATKLLINSGFSADIRGEKLSAKDFATISDNM